MPNARIAHLAFPAQGRIIAISDIHGQLGLLTRLLDQLRLGDYDHLILLGDLYTKGPKPHETLRAIIDLCRQPNIHALRGNCDWPEPYLTPEETQWLERLPHIIDTKDYTFVHGGLRPGPLESQQDHAVMKNDAFMEQGLAFDKYIVTGHWPTVNYTHQIPCANPIVNHAQRIIAVDGGATIKSSGQLNAFIIDNGGFSFMAVDDLPRQVIQRPQAASGGTLNVCWNDRFVTLVETRGTHGLYRHPPSGRVIELPRQSVYTDGQGNLCASVSGTDYFLPLTVGDVVSVVTTYDQWMLAKKDGVIGWIRR